MRTVAGLDLCNDVSQISVAEQKDNGRIEVDTLPVEVGSEKFCIHTCAMKYSGRQEWIFGEEAYRAPMDAGHLLNGLLDLAVSSEYVTVDGQEYDTVTLLSHFIRSTLRGITFKGDWPEKPVLFITVRDLSPKILKTVKKAAEKLELNEVDIRFLSHAESCFYYTASQAQELKLHKVCLLDYDNKTVRSSILNTNRQMRPVVTFIEEREFDLPKKDDLEMLNICREIMDSEIISSVYLAGVGFEENWTHETVRYLCMKKRRVFMGMNLYTKGACYAALDITGIKNITGGEIFLDKDKLKVNIGIDISSKGQVVYRSLIEAGINWFEATASLEVMLGEIPEIRIIITPINGEGERTKVIRTQGIPERPERATRALLELEMLSVNELKCTVTDLGLGELFPATGNVTTEVMTLNTGGEEV